MLTTLYILPTGLHDLKEGRKKDVRKRERIGKKKRGGDKRKTFENWEYTKGKEKQKKG